MNDEGKPRIAITLGDPAGIGPEIIVGAWVRDVMHQGCCPMVIGRPEILRRAVSLLGTGAQVVEIDSPEEANPRQGVIPCIAIGSPEASEVEPGTIDSRAGQAAYDATVAATQLALDGKVDAMTTAPLHKEALRLAGKHYPGHTELLAQMCHVDDYAMMLYLGPGDQVRSLTGLAVVHVTLHIPMREVSDKLGQEAILAKARLADRFMSQIKGSRVKIGVCAFNPHGGEGGLFGREEIEIIRPAVKQGLDEGLQLEGPTPTDTLMVHARDGHYDVVVAMYHDQGHIALKLLGMHRAVNITLGLPILRTSVAHGTAFDLAWQGRADVGSLIEAVRIATRLASQRCG